MHAEIVHASELKLWHFSSFPMFEAMHLQCFTPTRYVRGVATHAHKRDDHYPICSQLNYASFADTLGLCGAIRTIFFCLVRGPLEITH